MRVIVMPPEFYSEGNVRFSPTEDSDFGAVTRRVTRRATINGGVWIDDFGAVEGDKTMRLNPKVMSRADYGILKALVATYSQLTLICKDGVFLGSMQSLNDAAGIEMVFLVKEKMDG